MAWDEAIHKQTQATHALTQGTNHCQHCIQQYTLVRQPAAGSQPHSESACAYLCVDAKVKQYDGLRPFCTAGNCCCLLQEGLLLLLHEGVHCAS